MGAIFVWVAGAPEKDAHNVVASKTSIILRSVSALLIARTIREIDRGGGIVKGRNREVGVTAPEGRQHSQAERTAIGFVCEATFAVAFLWI